MYKYWIDSFFCFYYYLLVDLIVVNLEINIVRLKRDFFLIF